MKRRSFIHLVAMGLPALGFAAAWPGETPGRRLCEKAPAPLLHGPKSNPAILVVDDEPAFREVMPLILEFTVAAQTLAVADTAAALQALSQKRFDLVITDIARPKSSGLDLILRMRASGCVHPVLVFSGLINDIFEARAMKCGATACLAKPANLQELQAAVEQCLPHGLPRSGTALAAA